MHDRKQANSERIYKMEYTNDPVEGMVDDIREPADVLAKVLFAGFNIVFIVVLGIILITNLAMH